MCIENGVYEQNQFVKIQPSEIIQGTVLSMRYQGDKRHRRDMFFLESGAQWISGRMERSVFSEKGTSNQLREFAKFKLQLPVALKRVLNHSLQYQLIISLSRT